MFKLIQNLDISIPPKASLGAGGLRSAATTARRVLLRYDMLRITESVDRSFTEASIASKFTKCCIPPDGRPTLTLVPLERTHQCHVNRWMLGHYSKPMMEGAGGTVGIVVAGSGDTRWSSNVPGREPGAIIRGSDGARMGCLRRKFKTTQTAVPASYNCSNQESYPASTVSMMLKMSLTYTASIAAMATSYCWALSL